MMKKEENQSLTIQTDIGKRLPSLTKQQQFKLISDAQNYYEMEQAMQEKRSYRKELRKYKTMLSIALVFLIGILGTIFTISSVHMINLGRDLPYCRFTRMNMDRNFEPICSVCVPGYILIDTLECIEF